MDTLTIAVIASLTIGVVTAFALRLFSPDLPRLLLALMDTLRGERRTASIHRLVWQLDRLRHERAALHRQLHQLEQRLATITAALQARRVLIDEASELKDEASRLQKQRDWPRAAQAYRRALALERTTGPRRDQAQTLAYLGEIYATMGDLDQAQAHYKEALKLHRQIGNPLGQAQTLGSLGLVAEMRGDIPKARELLQQAVALYRKIGAGGEGPEDVRAALEALQEGKQPTGEPKPKRRRKKRPPKKP